VILYLCIRLSAQLAGATESQLNERQNVESHLDPTTDSSHRRRPLNDTHTIRLEDVKEQERANSMVWKLPIVNEISMNQGDTRIGVVSLNCTLLTLPILVRI
jgi:hypothetical protein